MKILEIQNVEFDVSGKKYIVNNCCDEEHIFQAIRKLMLQELCFKGYVKPIFGMKPYKEIKNSFGGSQEEGKYE